MIVNDSIYLDGTYLEHSQSWHLEDSPWKAKQVLKMLERHQLNPASVCEIGCGAGEILRQIADALGPGKTCIGYDISPQAIHLAKQKARADLNFQVLDIRKDATPTYDLVMAIDVFEHVENYIEFLRALRPKGRHALFHIPLDMNVQMVLRAEPIRRVRDLVGHLHYFSKDTALATLEHSGFDVIDYFYTPNQIELPNLSLKAKTLKLPRRLAFALNPDLAVRILGGYSLLVLAR